MVNDNGNFFLLYWAIFLKERHSLPKSGRSRKPSDENRSYFKEIKTTITYTTCTQINVPLYTDFYFVGVNGGRMLRLLCVICRDDLADEAMKPPKLEQHSHIKREEFQNQINPFKESVMNQKD